MLFIGGSFRGEGHQWSFGVIGEGWGLGVGHAFRYRKNNIYKISNAFSAIQGAQILKFPRGYLPNASKFTLFLSHLIIHAPLTPWFTTCAFSTVNSRRIFSNLDRILWEQVGMLVTPVLRTSGSDQRHSIFFQNWNWQRCPSILTKIRMYYLFTTFEDSYNDID